MNTNGFQALYCNHDGYAEIPWTKPDKNQFSIALHFLPDTVPKEGTLLSLDDNLKVGFSAGNLQVNGTGSSCNSEYTALPQCKNTLVIVCNDSDIEVYCNGIPAVTITLSDYPGRVSHLRIGENLPAVCIFDVTVFHKLLTLPEILQCSAKKPAQYQNRVVFSDGTVPADITLHQCQIENCVYTLDCRDGAFSLPDADLPEKYTISFSVHLTDLNRMDGVLFQSPDFKVKILYERGSIAPHLFIQYTGGPEINVPRSFKRNQWINITFVFDGFQYYIYFDGSFIQRVDYYPSGTHTGDITFGPFDGYMDTCIIVDHAVSRDELAGFLKNPPGIFDTDLLYLFDFGSRLLQESRHNTNLTSSGAKIVLARGTGALTGVKKRIAAPENERTYSDFVNWQIGVIIRLLVEWIHEQFGIYPNRGNIDMEKDPWEIEVNLRQFIHKEILSMAEAQELLFYYDDTDKREQQNRILNLIQAMEKNGTLKKLMEYLYQEDDDQDSIYDIIRAMLIAAALAAIMSAIANMLNGIKLPPKPPKLPDLPDLDDDDDDEKDKKKKKTNIRIKQTALKGDLHIIMDEGTKLHIASDIAETEKETQSTAVFIKENRTGIPTVKVEFSFRGDNDEFIVSAKNTDGHVIADIQQSVSYSGSNPPPISLQVHPENFRGKYGKCSETLKWQCRSKDGKQSTFLGETAFELYFLEKRPCGPWKDSVPIECLELCADCAKHAGNSSTGFFMDYINYIMDGMAKQDNMADVPEHAVKESFTQINPNKDKKSIFDVKGFTRACRSGGRDITYYDRVYSTAIFGYLQGDAEIGTLGLCSGITWKDKNGMQDGARLLFRKAGQTEDYFCPEEYIHSVTTRGTNIYDALLGVKGLPFSENPNEYLTGDSDAHNYREKYYLEGSYCRQLFSLNGDDWQLENGLTDFCRTAERKDADRADDLPEGPIVGLVVPGSNGYMHQYRTAADEAIMNHIRNQLREDPDFTEVCHSISSYQIDLIIANICNTIEPHRLDLHPFDNLIAALYPIRPAEQNDFTNCCYRSTLHLADTLARRLANGNRDLYTNNLILHFCCLAANSPANLRMGRGDWNRSIQDDFDPEKWFYFGDANSECIISNFHFDERCVQGQLIATLTGRYQGIPSIPADQPGYYLASIKDGIRITKLCEMGYPVNMIRKYVMDPGPVFYPLILSSSNHFPHEGAGGVRDRYIDPPVNLPPIPIFYISSDAQGDTRWTRL